MPAEPIDARIYAHRPMRPYGSVARRPMPGQTMAGGKKPFVNAHGPLKRPGGGVAKKPGDGGVAKKKKEPQYPHDLGKEILGTSKPKKPGRFSTAVVERLVHRGFEAFNNLPDHFNKVVDNFNLGDVAHGGVGYLGSKLKDITDSKIFKGFNLAQKTPILGIALKYGRYALEDPNPELDKKPKDDSENLGERLTRIGKRNGRKIKRALHNAAKDILLGGVGFVASGGNPLGALGAIALGEQFLPI